MTKKVLMIDDDPDFVSGIRSILTAADFEVDVAYNPKDGLAMPCRPSNMISCCSIS